MSEQVTVFETCPLHAYLSLTIAWDADFAHVGGQSTEWSRLMNKFTKLVSCHYVVNRTYNGTAHGLQFVCEVWCISREADVRMSTAETGLH